MPKNTTFFSKNLIVWYLQNGRTLPWRETRDPYKIWLSEILLQQTRVAQGLPYYIKFIEAYPDVHKLAQTSEESVLKLWQGLGYYSRARNLHFTARYIVEQYQGVFPDNYKDLLKLRGVGDYTASAIASICFDEPAAVVDGNVYRVLSRIFGIATPINSTSGVKEFKKLAQILIDEDQPGTFNQAVMEFGARYCVPKNPDCDRCIFSEKCLAFKMKKVNALPVKINKTKVKQHYFNFIVPISAEDTTILEQRKGKGIWQNLYQFPLVESDSELSLKELLKNETYKNVSEKLKITSLTLYNSKTVLHKLSHKHLHTRFWIAEVDSIQEGSIKLSEIQTLPVPILIGNFISEFSAFKD
ncbi:MAG: A/G-specific adenine glycosylase [Bacteroidota bacterium]